MSRAATAGIIFFYNEVCVSMKVREEYMHMLILRGHRTTYDVADVDYRFSAVF